MKTHTYEVQWKSLSYSSQGRWIVEGKHDWAEDAVSHATQLAKKRSNQRGKLRVIRFRHNAGSPAISTGVEESEVFYSVLTDAVREYDNHWLHFLGINNLD